MITIGIAGTAKNTGKTTALVALIDRAVARGLRLGLTGIGYDGEERDTVTLLPKPRIRVPAGALVTTSESCLQGTDTGWSDLRRTGFRTALGEVVVVRVTRPGLLVVAGPNKTHELEQIRGMLAGDGLELLLVDGSLNRIAPMAVADRIVFSTGAARSNDLAAVAGEMQAIESLFGIPRAEPGAEGERDYAPIVSAATPRAEAKAAAAQFGRVRWKGLVALELFAELASVLERRGATVVLDDPLKLLLAGDIRRVSETVSAAQARGLRLACERVPFLAAVTSNPFYPAYDGTVYSGGTVDPGRLQAVLQAAIRTPVVDVVRQGGEALFALAWPA